MDKVQHIGEWFIVTVLLLGSISTLFADPITTGTPLVLFLGSQAAVFFYSGVIALPGLMLGYAKARHKRVLHKNALLFTYLLTIFLTILEWMLLGFGWTLIDQVILGILAGWFWLRWKFKTEYIDLEEFQKQAINLKNVSG